MWILIIILSTSIILSVVSDMMFNNTMNFLMSDLMVENTVNSLRSTEQLEKVMEYKELLFYLMILGSATLPFTVYFLFDNYRWAKYLAALSILPWCGQEELYKMGCNPPILALLSKHSNLFDEAFNGKYAIEDGRLPDGVTKEKFEWCVDFIYDKRLPSEEDLDIQLDHWENICSGVIPQCFATFDNGTEVRIQCPDYPWKCGIVDFDNYKVAENEN